MSKQTRSLQDARSTSKQVHVAIGVRTPPPPADDPWRAKEPLDDLIAEFSELCQPMIARIEDLGGTVETLGWSNSTVYAVLPSEVVDGLESLDRIVRIDLAGAASLPGEGAPAGAAEEPGRST